MAFDREKIKRTAGKLAAEGIYIGISSWKYQLCRVRHKGYFHDDVPMKIFSLDNRDKVVLIFA